MRPYAGDADASCVPRRPLAGFLALASLVIPAVGLALTLSHAGGIAAPLMVVAGIPLAVLAWVALGRPRTRRDCRERNTATGTSY